MFAIFADRTRSGMAWFFAFSQGVIHTAASANLFDRTQARFDKTRKSNTLQSGKDISSVF